MSKGLTGGQAHLHLRPSSLELNKANITCKDLSTGDVLCLKGDVLDTC